MGPTSYGGRRADVWARPVSRHRAVCPLFRRVAARFRMRRRIFLREKKRYSCDVPSLRYRADRRTLVFVGLYFVFLGAAWWSFPRLPLWAVPPVVAFLAVWSWVNAVITHNVLHCPL